MLSLLNIPCTRYSLRNYAIIALCVGFVISFILIAFQPFGTSHFVHEYKWLILSGYGVTTALSMFLFFFIKINTIDRVFFKQWNIIYEIVDMFLASILSMTACYVYSIFIFDRTFSIPGLLNFLMIISSVAVLPTLAYLVSLYYRWVGVKEMYLMDRKGAASNSGTLDLLGSDRKEYSSISFDKILLVSAQDNYVMLYIKLDHEVVRHIIRNTLKSVKIILGEQSFIQVHRSHIVNRSKITKVEGNKSKAFIEILEIKKPIPISRAVYDELKSVL